MITIQEYLLSKKHNKLGHTIHATDDTIKQIVKDELDRLGYDANLNHIDVSEVTHMAELFRCDSDNLERKYRDINPDISEWDVSNVEYMQFMFYYCENFNKDLSGWDVSKVEDMCCMFYGCENFNQDLSRWDVSKVHYMNYMFYNCENFNQDLSKWNVSYVEDMNGMFYGCKKFNQDLSRWDISKVERAAFIFNDCPIKEEYKPKFIKNKR